MIDASIIALAVLNAGVELVDLHTTSEIVKRRLGRELNKGVDRLTDLNDGTVRHARKFWSLVAVKLAMIAVIAGIAAAGVLTSSYIPSHAPPLATWLLKASAVLTFVGLLLIRAPIMRRNWNILKGQ